MALFRMALFRMAFFVFSSWFFVFSRGEFRYFVFWPGVISSFRCFAWRYFVSTRGVFRRFAWRYIVFSPRHNAIRKKKWHKSATIETTSFFNSEDHEIPVVVGSNPSRTIPKV